MAVSEWNTVPGQNTHLGDYSLSGPYGHIFAEMMAQLKAEIDSIKASIEDATDAMGEWTTASPARTTTAKAAIEALEVAMGSWTDTTETSSVKAAVEGVEASIGAWTDPTEDTTVKAAIEALRPEGE